MFSDRFISNFIVKFYNSFKTYNYKNTKYNYTQYSQLPKNKKTNPMLLKQHTLRLIMCIIYLWYKIKLVVKSANGIMSYVIKTDRIML